MIGGYAASGPLTPRMREVLALAAAGARDAEIAVQLGIATHTVAHIRRNACERLGARTLAAAVYLYAKAEG